MQIVPKKIVDQFKNDCLQIILACSQEDVDALTRLGKLCDPLMPLNAELCFSGLTIYDAINKHLIIPIPPGYSDKAIEASIRRTCTQLKDDLEHASRVYRANHYNLGSLNETSRQRRYSNGA